ncbi:MAG: aspartate-semialdehyde dehydrogenase [Phycisphaerae bacterium]|jgi:aspartate-semialdehyde dehydrogenase
MKHIAIVGATGAVGRELLTLLAERAFPAASCRLFASARSAGQQLPGPTGPLTVEELGPDAFAGVDIALFSAGGAISRQFAPIAQAAGTLVIDNSSAFRLVAGVPLVIPEINGHTARQHHGLIANPNCSAIILTMALWPLHQLCSIRRIVVATYQAVSGAGARALAELETQTRAVLAGEPAAPSVFPVPCAFNVFSHNTPIAEDGYNIEERKVIAETRHILGAPDLAIAPTCMRVPVRRAHTEAVSIEFTAPVTEDQARAALNAAAGVTVVDDRDNNRFPTPLDASGRDDVLVGRIRRDPSVADGRGLQLVCCGDQLRKGAALNALQIAELLMTGE